MPKYYRILTPAIVFNHDEHGERLIFKNGETNPRNELGKNGITIHRFPASLFHPTITIFVAEIDKYGIHHANHEFKLNRNSLVKYLGADAEASDDELIEILNQNLWASHDLNNPTKEVKAKQDEAGNHLRHAGQHNKRVISHWSDPISDFFKGSFFSWLYQVTIRSISFIKLRFFFWGSEKDLNETSEILAKTRFKDAAEAVPAFKTHIQNLDKNDSDLTFGDIPITSKANYIKPQQDHDWDTHLHGQYPTLSKTDTSTGTTGPSTNWVRSAEELDTVKKSLELAAKLQMGSRKLHNINAFALGPWATGLTSYELMRETGSVFATGPDKEKILSELIRIQKYEQHQLKQAVDKLSQKYSAMQDDHKSFITTVIDIALKAVLKDRDLKLADALSNQIIKFSNEAQRRFFNAFKDEIQAIAETLNEEKVQIIVAGYPPFLKDLAEFIKAKGHNLSDFSAIGVAGGQAISEAMRDILIKDGFNQIFSSYGASDLDINLGVETEYEMLVRKTIERNPGLARELYGSNKGLPMVFHYDPWNYHVECLDGSVDKPEETNSLIFTANRDDRSSPRIRYDLGDKGRVYASSDVQALLAKYGVFQKPKTNLPLMFVWGRDSTVVFGGANLDFTELERAIEEIDLNGEILKKAFHCYQDNEGREKLRIMLELKEGMELPQDPSAYAQRLLSKLASLNQDFRYQLEALDEGTILPELIFFKRGQSPIGEAGGHRKQVLVIQKENWPENYQLPSNNDICVGQVKMSRELLGQGANSLII